MVEKSHRRAYSYVRFSHAKQAQGGSLKRQTKLTEEYCKRKGLTLDDTLSLLDLGVSAFRGNNVKEGALAAFLEACRSGRVPRGSCLIVESLDRLSRDQIRPALQLFLSLQDYGITIITLEPEREYSPDGSDALSLIEPLIIFSRAHEESVTKGHRRGKAWEEIRNRARQSKTPLMKTCPAWLKVEGDKYVIKEQAKKAVRRIFELAIGGDGVHTIPRKLKEEGYPPIGTSGVWVGTYVYKILTHPAAKGTYQPRKYDGKKYIDLGPPIEGFYPPVVTEAEWDAANAAVTDRGDGRGAGRKGSDETNLFTRLVFSAVNGERMQIVNAAGRREKNGKRLRYYYLCETTSGTPGGRRIDYNVFEDAILSKFQELRPEDIAEGERCKGRDDEIAKLSGILLDIDDRLERAKTRAQKTEDFDSFLDLIQGLQGRRKEVSARLATLRMEASNRPSEDLGATQSLIGILSREDGDGREDLRRRLKARIRQLVEEVRLLIVRRRADRLCAVQVYFSGGAKVRSYLIFHRGGRAFRKSTWQVFSFADITDKDDLDLRNKKDVRTLEKVLEGLDLDSLAD